MERARNQASLPALAIAGSAVWCGGIAWLQPGWAEALLLLAPLVAVPLALPLLQAAATTRGLLLASAVLLVPAYGCERGLVAGGWTLPWLAMCSVFTIHELWHWPRRHDVVAVLVKGYLAYGASWVSLARLGVRPLGFDDVIVHATAVHFHYAGILLPTLLLRLSKVDPAPATRWALWGVLAGMPLVAGGITLTLWKIHELELAATLWFTLACWIAAWRQTRLALSLTRLLPKALLLVSSAALAAAMILACLYALRPWLDTGWLDIPLMVRVHGSLQVFGFALPALAAWWILDSTTSALGPPSAGLP